MARVQTRKNVSVSAAKYAELRDLKARTGVAYSQMVEDAVERDCPPVALPPGKPRKVRP